MEGDAEERQIQARFVTKLKPPFKASAAAITIPANITRLGLSTIVNSLLKAGTVRLNLCKEEMLKNFIVSFQKSKLFCSSCLIL